MIRLCFDPSSFFYLREVDGRSAYTLLFSDPTCGITLVMLSLLLSFYRKLWNGDHFLSFSSEMGKVKIPGSLLIRLDYSLTGQEFKLKDVLKRQNKDEVWVNSLCFYFKFIGILWLGWFCVFSFCKMRSRSAHYVRANCFSHIQAVGSKVLFCLSFRTSSHCISLVVTVPFSLECLSCFP